MVKAVAKNSESNPLPTEIKAKSKTKKMMLIIIGCVLTLGITGGAGWYFAKSDDHNGNKSSKPPVQAKFIALDPFTVNLQRESADQFLQIGITLKIVQPELEEKIKQNLPEIRSRLLVLLAGKYPSELTTSKGKKKLVNEIIADTEIVLGLRTAPTLSKSIVAASASPPAVPSVDSANPVDADSSEESSTTPEEAKTTEVKPAKPSGEVSGSLIDVLFTSFIIQ
ncbi:MAG: flagellar basal body-associated FliL family protein [Candidatus Nitrotoga sp.]